MAMAMVTKPARGLSSRCLPNLMESSTPTIDTIYA
jgi:hypothetical protein